MKTAKFKFNDRVEFKDSESNFHVGYVKIARRVRKGWFSHHWVYNICEHIRGTAMRKVYTIPEADIFGIVEKREYKPSDKPLDFKEHKTYNDFSSLKEIINNNKTE